MHHPMKHIAALFLLLILTGCGHPGGTLPPSLTALSPTSTQIATATPSPLPTSQTPEVRALVKKSIEFYRNGKTYEVVVGYNAGDVFWNVTPKPVLPKKYDEVGWGTPKLNGYADFDKDGETEFYVSVYYCGGSGCSTELRLYKYDRGQDQYIVADHVSSGELRIDRYEDLNQDGNPEIIVSGMGYCLYGDAGDKVFSVVTVLRFEKGKITDVTKEFPSVIAEDAEHNLSFSKTDGGHQGVAELLLASYLYDMSRLGLLDEARPNFDQVCNDVVKPRKEKAGRSIDCLEFRAEVETDIQKYEQSKSQK